MHHHYKDIRDKLGEPQWWDEVGVPRYCEFGPDETNNIYASQIVLAEIACQSCERLFQVAMSYHPYFDRDVPTLRDRIEKSALHYGDPPNAGCCPAGPTMSSEARRVLQFWEQGELHEWTSSRRLSRQPAANSQRAFCRPRGERWTIRSF